MDWNCEGIGGEGVTQFAWGGFSSDFQRGKTAKALLEFADLITFPVCKLSSIEQGKDQLGRCWQSHGKVSGWVVQ